jgi:FAD/FMN-containing dehydrogenase
MTQQTTQSIQKHRGTADGVAGRPVYRRPQRVTDGAAPKRPYCSAVVLPENGFDVARALVGSESTLGTILHAELVLVPKPPAESLVVLGYSDIAAAADAAPHGDAWLMVIFPGESKDDADAKAHALLDELHGTEHEPTVKFYDDAEHENELADVREVALGATARVPDMPDTWEGWEDSAVPPDRLGDYLRDLIKLYDEFGYSGSALYGHFGQGCVHTRIPFDLVTADGIATFRRFIERAADLVVSYGGSFSGEHGDGQSRGELLPKMCGEDLVRAFGQFKAIFDPDNRMNPGKVVAPYRIDENLRLGTEWTPRDDTTFFGYPNDDGRFERAVMRCVGVPGRAVAGHLHQPPDPVYRPGRHRGTGGGRLPGDHPGTAAVLRPDLDLHRPAGHGPAGAPADGGHPRALPARRRPGGGPGTELYRGVPLRRQ